jgi:hypothetical protein
MEANTNTNTKAKRKAKATTEAIAAAVAAAPIEAPKAKTKAAWDSKIGRKADGAVTRTVDAIDAVDKAGKAAALALSALYGKGFHTKAGWTNFAKWFVAASEALNRPVALSTVSRLRAAGEALDAMGETAAAACDIPTDILASAIGVVRKDTRDPIAIGSALRMKTKAFTEARANGATVRDSAKLAGLVKDEAPASAEALDGVGKAKRIVASLYTLSGKNWAEARRILQAAAEELDRQAAAALRVAAGEEEAED